MPYFSTLRSQLVLTIVIVAVALACREGLILQREFAENRLQANELTLSVAQGVSGNVELFLWDERVMLMRLAEDPRIREMEGVSCSAPLMEIRPLLQFNVNLLVVDSTGRMRCSGLGPPQPGVAELGDREWFSAVRENLAFHVGGPLVGRHTGQWVAPLVYPIVFGVGLFAFVMLFQRFGTERGAAAARRPVQALWSSLMAFFLVFQIALLGIAMGFEVPLPVL